VREAELRLESATQTAKADRRALFPTFTLMPGGSLTKTMGAYDSFSTLWQVGVGAALPVLDRPRLLADLRAQTARGEQAVAAYEKAVQSAYSDAENGLTTLQSDETRLGLLSDAEARARVAYQANDTGYRAGLIDLTTVLQVEQSWLTARASLTAARSTALQDAVTTFKALGGGWTPSAPAQTAASGARAR
jgi:outer membrane protein TolC